MPRRQERARPSSSPKELEKDGGCAPGEKATPQLVRWSPEGEERRVIPTTSLTTKTNSLKDSPCPGRWVREARLPGARRAEPGTPEAGPAAGKGLTGVAAGEQGQSAVYFGRARTSRPRHLRCPPGGSEPARPPLPAPQEPTTPAEAAVPPAVPCRPALREGLGAQPRGWARRRREETFVRPRPPSRPAGAARPLSVGPGRQQRLRPTATGTVRRAVSEEGRLLLNPVNVTAVPRHPLTAELGATPVVTEAGNEAPREPPPAARAAASPASASVRATLRPPTSLSSCRDYCCL